MTIQLPANRYEATSWLDPKGKSHGLLAGIHGIEEMQASLQVISFSCVPGTGIRSLSAVASSGLDHIDEARIR